ncbi:MAG: hypothetical protein KDI39_15450 [Pseudomonadales bacterium]|nr:hypothetical protein [Pseudomonadales bacterium]
MYQPELLNMPYLCKDCGNKSSQKFPQGKCPACGSFNIKTPPKSTRQAIKEKEPKTLIEIVILCILWAVLGYGFWNKFIKESTPTAVSTSKQSAPSENIDF